MSTRDEFFIGYLPGIPKGIRSRVMAAMAVIVVVGGAMAVLGAVLQRDPGKGQWKTERTTLSGVFRALPYPHVVIGTGATARSVLLVCEGKHAPGADNWCGPIPDGLGAPSRPVGSTFDPISIDGRSVSVTGLELRRLDFPEESLTALELGSEDEDLKLTDAVPVAAPAGAIGDAVTLEGEVVDPKCFLGAMKPGDGRVHRACAWLCIKGGIAPVLVTGSGANRRCVVLATTTGGSACAMAAEFAGDRVRIKGELVELQGLATLRVSNMQRVP